ncbi:unnamed protein product [Durusdinium trenchii]|uniref:Uncharacterized protein n=2 Tax=Durusdinium trenchii TaxID=1381693 RepID=A0ABP0IHY2_9DINO
MGHYHSKTPKRHVGYSNSEKVGLLNLGKLRGWDYESSKYKSSRTAITKVDQDGKKTFQGCKKQLKDSQTYPYRFGLRVLRILPDLIKTGCKELPACPEDFDPLTNYCCQSFTDLWDDAHMCEVLQYLRGNTNLNIPAEWKPHLLN